MEGTGPMRNNFWVNYYRYNFFTKELFYEKIANEDDSDKVLDWLGGFDFSEYLKNIDTVFAENYRCQIILSNPEFVDLFDLKTFGEAGLYSILSSEPNYINRINKDYVRGDYLRKLLTEHPHLIDYFDITTMEGYNIGRLMAEQQQIISKINLDILDSTTVLGILKYYPQFINIFSSHTLKKLGNSVIEKIINAQPLLVAEFNQILASNEFRFQKFPLIAKHKDNEQLVLFVGENVGTILVENIGKSGSEIGLCYKSFVSISNKEIWEIVNEPITLTFKSSHIFVGRNFPHNINGAFIKFVCVAKNKASYEIALIPDQERGTIIGNCTPNRMGYYFRKPNFDDWEILNEITLKFDL